MEVTPALMLLKKTKMSEQKNKRHAIVWITAKPPNHTYIVVTTVYGTTPQYNQS